MTPTIRALNTGDWAAFKAMRLRALQINPGVYLATYAETIARPDDSWREMLGSPEKCFFGLYDGEKLIGITGVFTWDQDPHKQTGFMGASFIEPDYRGHGFAKFLHKARIDWGIGYLPWKRLVIGHREGNEPSRRAILAQGFQFIGKKKITWPDGVEDWDYNYELDLEKLRRAQQ
jgi:RimJ/RimL family protein N-acetyltransferase